MARVFGISTNICSSVLSRHREELPVFCSKIETLFFKSKSIQLPSPVSPAFNFQTVQIPSSNIILTWSTWSTWSTSSRWCATMLLDVSKYFLPATFSLVPAINFQAGKWVTWVSQPRVFGITKKPLVSLDQLCLLLCVCGCPKLKAHWARQRNPYFTHISKRHGWRWHEKGSSFTNQQQNSMINWILVPLPLMWDSYEASRFQNCLTTITVINSYHGLASSLWNLAALEGFMGPIPFVSLMLFSLTTAPCSNGHRTMRETWREIWGGAYPCRLAMSLGHFV